MASRKDFEATAEIIARADLSPRQRRDLTRAFAVKFAGQTTPGFDRERFYEAAGLRPFSHDHVYGGGTLECRNCHSIRFIDAGRSLDTYNFECLLCGRIAHPLTETGASA